MKPQGNLKNVYKRIIPTDIGRSYLGGNLGSITVYMFNTHKKPAKNLRQVMLSAQGLYFIHTGREMYIIFQTQSLLNTVKFQRKTSHYLIYTSNTMPSLHEIQSTR